MENPFCKYTRPGSVMIERTKEGKLMNHLRNWSLAREIGSDKRETEGEFFGGEERIKF